MQIEYTFPNTKDMSQCQIIGTSSSMESAKENALWEYNSMRAHDGLKPINFMPRGTTAKIIKKND